MSEHTGEPRAGFTPGEPVRTRIRIHDGSDQAQRLRVLVDTLNQHSLPHTARITLVDTRTAGASDSIYVPKTPLLPRTVRVLHAPPDAAQPAPTHTPPAGPGAPAARTARILTIASGKGGVGKTNLAVNLSIALAQAGRRVALVDADMGVANADVLCGLNPRARLDQAIVAAGGGGTGAGTEARRTLNDLAVDAPGGFRLVPGAVAHVRSTDADPALRQRFMDGLLDLDTTADLIVLDAPAGVGPTVLACVEAADRTMVVATPEPTSIADAYALVKSFHLALLARGEHGGPAGAADLRLQLVVNQAADEREARRVHERIESVARRFLSRRVPLAGWVPADAQVSQAVRARQPFLLRSPNAAASKAVSHLASDLSVSLGLRPLPAPTAAAPQRARPGLVRRLLGL